MTGITRQQKRRADLGMRIANPERSFAACAVLDCGQPTMAGDRTGLNRHYCRRHVEHYRRHGSYWKRSYSAKELNPYRKSAYTWLKANGEQQQVCDAIERVHRLYWRAGRPEEAFRLAGKPPNVRAKVVWARLKQYQVDPLQVLAVWLAVVMCHADDVQADRHIEYCWVQAAKVLHRLAGGSHKRWERERFDGGVEVTELHKYPASRGRVLRHIGEALAEAAQPLDSHRDVVHAVHRQSVAQRGHRLPRVRRAPS